VALYVQVKERETELQDEKKVINTARDQCAKAMASWSAGVCRGREGERKAWRVGGKGLIGEGNVETINLPNLY
jgi:hypothetical protein